MNEGQRAIADYLLEQARWRGEKAEQYPEDARNLRCAAGLKELAEYVLGLSPTDERVLELTTLGVREGMFSPYPAVGPGGGNAPYAISRFRFHAYGADEDCEHFLARLVVHMRDDALAFAREQGELPDADE